MRNKISTDECIEKFKKIHGNKYDYSKFQYINCYEKSIIICKIHGVFFQKPYHHLQGSGCPICGGTKKYIKEDFVNKANLIHKNKYDYSKFNYINSLTKGEIICSKHGSFWQVAGNHVFGCGCPKCSNVYKPTNEEYIKRLKKIHNDEYDYSKVNYNGKNKKIEIICKIHGVFFQLPSNHLSGQGCPKCKGGIQSTKNKFIEKANKIHKNKYEYSKVDYSNNHKKVEIICPKHGTFYQTPSNHLDGRGCCKCIHRISKGEIEFLDYINLPNTKENRQVCILNKQVDGYDEKTNTIYEFLGDYYHGNPLIYKKDDYNPTCKKTFGKLYKLTKNRFTSLKTKGYKVYYIWESQWNYYKKNKKLYLNEFKYDM
jgi:hypothetical protein